MNCRRLIGMFLLIASAILLIAGLSSSEWYSRTFYDSSTLTCSLQKYTYTKGNESRSGSLGNAIASQLPLTGDSAKRFSEFLHDLYSTGTKVIICGALSIVLLVIGLAMFWNSDDEETRATAAAGCRRVTAYLLCLTSVSVAALGALLYVNAYGFGYSYPLFFLAGFIQIIGFVVLTMDVTHSHSCFKQTGGVFFVLLALLVLCLSMGLNGWYTSDQSDPDSKTNVCLKGTNQTGGVLSLGLVRFTFSPPAGSEISGWVYNDDWKNVLDDPNDQLKHFLSDWNVAQKAIMGTGVIDAVLTFFCMVAFFVRFFGRNDRLSTLAGFGLFGLLVAVSVAGLGIFIYSHELNVGNSFLVFVAGDFVTLTGTMVMANAASQAARDAQVAMLAGREEVRSRVRNLTTGKKGDGKRARV